MDQRKSDVILKLCDCEVKLNFILQVGIFVYFFQQWLCESTDNTFFIVVDHVLEKLINKLNLKISKIKSCIIVWVILVCKIEHHLVPFALFAWVYELMNKPIAELLDIVMAGDQVVEFEADLVGNIQVSYCFLFIRD